MRPDEPVDGHLGHAQTVRGFSKLGGTYFVVTTNWMVLVALPKRTFTNLNVTAYQDTRRKRMRPSHAAHTKPLGNQMTRKKPEVLP